MSRLRSISRCARLSINLYLGLIWLLIPTSSQIWVHVHEYIHEFISFEKLIHEYAFIWFVIHMYELIHMNSNVNSTYKHCFHPYIPNSYMISWLMKLWCLIHIWIHFPAEAAFEWQHCFDSLAFTKCSEHLQLSALPS